MMSLAQDVPQPLFRSPQLDKDKECPPKLRVVKGDK
jgi:hypothetical protein